MKSMIFKYQIIDKTTNINMPEGGEVLRVAMQGPAICIWAKVDRNKPMVTRCFEVIMTGESFDDGELSKSPKMKYIGTVLTNEDTLVVHLFERLEAEAQIPQMKDFFKGIVPEVGHA